MSVTEEAEEILALEQKQLCVSTPLPVRAWQSGMPDGMEKKGQTDVTTTGFFAPLSGGTQKRAFFFFPLHIPFSSMKDGGTRDARSEEKKKKKKRRGRREMSDIRQERDGRKCIGGTRFDKLSIEKNTKKHCSHFATFSLLKHNFLLKSRRIPERAI